MDPITLLAMVLFGLLIVCWLAIPDQKTAQAEVQQSEPVILTSSHQQA